MTTFIEVAIPLGVRGTFTYSVPAQFRDRIAIGMRVLAPFGRKLVAGCVVAVSDRAAAGFKIRAIEDLIDQAPFIPVSAIEMALWVAERYYAPPGEVIRALFPAGTQVSGTRLVSLKQKTADLYSGGFRPPGLRRQEEAILEILATQGSMTVKDLAAQLESVESWIDTLSASGWIQVETFASQPRVKAKEQLVVRVVQTGRDEKVKMTPAQERLYSAVASARRPLLLQEAVRSSRSTNAAARSLERSGLVEIAPVKIERMPAELAEMQDSGAFSLSVSQQEAFGRILEIIQQKQSARCLIHGVTGSGKTEVYLRLIAEVIKLGGAAMLLVPEIGLTPLLSRLVVSRFPNQVSLLHSGMSDGERFDQWRRIRDGEVTVVVGTRSAVFAPLAELRLIVVDEEQDASYKQDESPCYHAREVAWQRMQQAGGVLLLGSATPSVETYYSAVRTGETHYFCLPERIEARPMPRVEIVDMNIEFQRHGKNSTISQLLQEELSGCIQRGEQAIVLLNRRGYSRTLLCRSCGHVFMCQDCSVSMTYHQQEKRLVCHYCGIEKDVPSVCAECGGPYIYYTGVGTEQLESMLRSFLPAARIARLDRDTTQRRGALRKILLSFSEHELDVLVGTQILAKGHDFPNVTLVGVIAADSGLSFPDFRSAERTFQLLTQVAGRAGRGSVPGRVVIQSFYPDNYALRFAQKQDYEGFFQHEIDFRKLMSYPPFRDLTQILISDSDASKAARTAEIIAGALKQQAGNMEAASRPHVLGPAPAPLEKLRGKSRMQILLKYPRGTKAGPILQNCFDALGKHKISLSNVRIDIDPLSLL